MRSFVKAECVFCQTECRESNPDQEKIEFMYSLQQEGWQIIYSQQCNAQGIACPTCVRKPDFLRDKDSYWDDLNKVWMVWKEGAGPTVGSKFPSGDFVEYNDN